MVRRAAADAVRRAAVALAALLLPGALHAQALECNVTGTIARPHPEGPSAKEPRRIVPVGGYTLALSWAPEYCHGAGGRGDSFECGGGNRFGFVLHGLWPDGIGKDWPQYCATAPLLAPATIRTALCATPSPQLLQHEYAKHGTCMPDRDANRYFARSTGLYRGLRFPDMDALSRRQGLNAGKVAQAIADANPGLRADSVRITANRKGWLEEAWLCLDTGFKPTRCAGGQGGGVAAGAPIKIQRSGSKTAG